MTHTEQQIQLLIDKMRAIFRDATGPRTRNEYMAANGVSGLDWSFSLSADDIIDGKIPPRVAGCTGRAKVFCKLAADSELPCYVVATANYEDWQRAAAGRPNIINGHQIIAVDIDGTLRAFDPGRRKLEWIDGVVRPGNFINAVQSQPPYLIGAVVPGNEFAKCNTYQKLRNLYTSGNMENPEFRIMPNIATE